MSLAHVIHRIATDDSFANQFVYDPASALATAGLELNTPELAALQALMSHPGWQNLCSSTQAEIDTSVSVAAPTACSNT